MIRERNKEIEAVIEKLGDETHSTNKQLQQQFDQQKRRLEDKHRIRETDLENQLSELQAKFAKEQEQRIMLDDNFRTMSRRV